MCGGAPLFLELLVAGWGCCSCFLAPSGDGGACPGGAELEQASGVTQRPRVLAPGGWELCLGPGSGLRPPPRALFGGPAWGRERAWPAGRGAPGRAGGGLPPPLAPVPLWGNLSVACFVTQRLRLTCWLRVAVPGLEPGDLNPSCSGVCALPPLPLHPAPHPEHSWELRTWMWG